MRGGSFGRRLGPPLLFAAALLLAYSNAWNTAFVFDDHRSILGNPVVTSEPLSTALLRPNEGLRGGETLATRPLSALSFAVNYRLTGDRMAGFRAVNLLVHFAATCLLFGLLRRSFARCGPDLARDACWLATAIALLWSVHPLETAAVTYTVQRAEALASAFYLATGYCFLRAAEDREAGRARATLFAGGAVACCLLGMASKEIMASAPLVVLLYDRVYVSGSFREAWRRHGRWHAALFACWALLAVLVLRFSFQNETIGTYLTTTPFSYAASQAYYLCRYVFLVFWPGPLVFEYGFAPLRDPRWLVPCAAAVLAAIGLTLAAWRKAPRVAFLGLFFFAVLSVTSSVVPIAGQIAAEHRMYLASVAPLSLAVLGLHAALRRRLRNPTLRWVVLVSVVAALAAGEVARTWWRNRDYATPVALWEDTVRGAPRNVRALTQLAKLYGDAANASDATARMRTLARARALLDRAIEIEPAYGLAFNHRGTIRLMQGDRRGAREDFERAISIFPDDALGYVNRGRLRHREDPTGAEADYTKALALDAFDVRAAINRGALRHARGELELALADFDHAIRYQPDNAIAWANRGAILAQLGRTREAIASQQRALELYRRQGHAAGVEEAEAALRRLRGAGNAAGSSR